MGTTTSAGPLTAYERALFDEICARIRTGTTTARDATLLRALINRLNNQLTHS